MYIMIGRKDAKSREIVTSGKRDNDDDQQRHPRRDNVIKMQPTVYYKAKVWNGSSQAENMEERRRERERKLLREINALPPNPTPTVNHLYLPPTTAMDKNKSKVYNIVSVKNEYLTFCFPSLYFLP